MLELMGVVVLMLMGTVWLVDLDILADIRSRLEQEDEA